MDIVNRTWGKYEVLQLDYDCKVKKLTINPYKQISKQYHMHRSEHWLVTKGEATVYLEGVFYSLVKGESIDIPQTSIHYIANETDGPLTIIETQLGTYFGEDDIVRVND